MASAYGRRRAAQLAGRPASGYGEGVRTALIALAVVLSSAAALPSVADASAPATTASSGAAARVEGTGELKRPVAAMIAIPAGPTRLGANAAEVEAANRLCRAELHAREAEGCNFSIEGPDRRVWLSAFQIDRVEVTVAAYRACAQAGGCSPEPLLVADARFLAPELPITSVTWEEAQRYCAWRGARLPTEAEWERAARGRGGRIFPWGNDPRTNASNHGRLVRIGELGPRPYTMAQPDPSDGFALTAPVGSYAQGASEEGVLDLAGNAMEWTADWAPAADGVTAPGSVNPRGPAWGVARIARGGSWRSPLLFQRTTAREALPPTLRSPDVGFRCAR
jgi:formylglycine-generating enzyme required for sulfatase activity